MFHTLQSVWSAPTGALTRLLSEGGGMDQDLMSPLSTAAGQSFCSDAWLNDALVRLHRLARSGYGQDIQRRIDAYLPAVAFVQGCDEPHRRLFARRMVLGIPDSPQEGTLPDLGFVLRCAILGYRPPGSRGAGKCVSPASDDRFPLSFADDCYVTHMLLQALPCLRRTVRKERKKLRGHQIGLNVLLGFLLGLCPSAVKFPPFSVRVVVYRDIHRLLTCGGGVAFCEAHPMLMTMAFMEYCTHLIPSYMPAEHDIILSDPGMVTFFSCIPVASDVFRQEMLNDLEPEGSIPWARLEEHCALVVDKYARLCKNRSKARRDDHGLPSRITCGSDVVCAFSSLPYLPPYDAHLDDCTHRLAGSELAMVDMSALVRADLPDAFEGASGIVRLSHEGSLEAQGGAMRRGQVHDTVAVMQRLLFVSALPSNIVRMQLRSLRVCMGECERSALEGMRLYVCASCGLCNSGSSRSVQVRGQCRLDGALFPDDFTGGGCPGARVGLHALPDVYRLGG